MNFRTTAILIVCLAVLGGVYLLTRGGLLQTPGTEVSHDPLVPGGLVNVKVTRGDTTFELRKGAAGWEQTAPHWFPLTSEAGQVWAAAVRGLIPQRELMPGVDDTPGLAELSLAPPTAEVELITDRGAFHLALGDQTVSHTGYVRTDDGRVFVVPDGLHTLAFQARLPEGYVRTMPGPPVASVASILIDRPREPVTLDRIDGDWSLTPDRIRRVSPRVVEALQRLLAETPILSFADAPPGRQTDDPSVTPGRRYGLDTPRARIVLRSADDTTHTLELGRASALKSETIFARLSRGDTPGPVMTIPAEAAAVAFEPWTDFRDRRVFATDAAQVRSLHVEATGANGYTIEDAGSGLAFAATDADQTADPGQAQDTVRRLLLWEAGQFVGDYQPFTEAIATVTLRWGVTKETVVDLYVDGDNYVALRRDEPDGMTLSTAAVRPVLEAR